MTIDQVRGMSVMCYLALLGETVVSLPYVLDLDICANLYDIMTTTSSKAKIARMSRSTAGDTTEGLRTVSLGSENSDIVVLV